MASAARPDVVLLDIGLPGMDGFQVAQRLRERPDFKDVVICAVAGYTPSESSNPILDKHQSLVGKKPANPRALLLRAWLACFAPTSRIDDRLTQKLAIFFANHGEAFARLLFKTGRVGYRQAAAADLDQSRFLQKGGSFGHACTAHP
jgi:CheY-like chemotaxis protein